MDYISGPVLQSKVGDGDLCLEGTHIFGRYFKREDDNLYTENGVTEGYQSGMGFPGGASGKKPACQCRRHKRCGFDP